jgi:nucleoside-diphosphate-sugar epimerase
MTTLVTGATGRVGSHFVPRLLSRGHPVQVLARDRGRAQALRERGADVVEGDVRDAGALPDALSGADAVVHLAASFRGVPDNEAREVNQAATAALGRAALEAGVRRFVFASTNLVYGPGRGRPAREDDEPSPTGAYPESKASAERALRELDGDGKLGLRIARLAFVYGEGDPHLHEVLAWARDWPAHKRLHLVHHADVAQGLLRALLADGLDGETFNVADDAPVTALDLLRLGGESPAADAADRPLEDPWEGIVDASAMRERLGLRPIYPSVWTALDAGAL